MNACERSDDDDDDSGGGGAEQSGPLPPELRMRSAAESSVGVSGNSCSVEQARCSRLANRSVLVHGLCATAIALATVRFLPSFTTLAICLVGLCVLSSVLRMLSCGHRSAKANAHDHDGCPRKSSPSVPQQRPSEPTATPTSGGGPLSFVKRRPRLLMRIMLCVPRFLVIRLKRSRQSTRRCRDTASRVTTDTASCSTDMNAVDMVTGSWPGNDYVHRNQRQYLVCTAGEQQ